MSEAVGIIGLGVLGSAIAENMLKGGLTLVGFDTNPAASTPLIELGFNPLTSAGEATLQANILFTCLPNVAALASVCDEVADAGQSGQIVVELSTLPVVDKEAARTRLAASDITLLDIPVSGNRIMALRKGLTAFGSGDRTAYDRVEPILLTFCKKAHYVGEFGCGSKMKFVGNMLNLVHNSIAAEAMVLGMKSGLDAKLIHEVISGSGSSSAMFEVRGALMAENDYRREGMNFSVPLKDSRIISEHAARLSCPTPIYQAALQSYYAAVAQGHRDEDQSAVCAAMERAANCERD
ncbi:MAG: NAD(P)-dependent oxidoreductase [Pseudomonadota bacterium]